MEENYNLFLEGGDEVLTKRTKIRRKRERERLNNYVGEGVQQRPTVEAICERNLPLEIDQVS